MKKICCAIILVISPLLIHLTLSAQSNTIRKGNLVYDFSFVESAIKFIETGDSSQLITISQSEAAKHIFNHAVKFNYSVPKTSTLALVKYLLSDTKKNLEILPIVKRNLQYARDSIALTDLPQKECLKYLPEGFSYNTRLFFTFGYDKGVVYGSNASVNLANPHYLQNMHEIRYYSIHELHHAGFVKMKNNFMPDLTVHTYSEMADLIGYYTHLEGMGTYAPLALRQREHAMNDDPDYIAIQDSVLMKKYEEEYFQTYFSFKNNPQAIVTDKDWDKISVLSDEKRLWYRIGAHMAGEIDEKPGRKKLNDLITEPSGNFIKAYLAIKAGN
jgi:hypothetical protein